LAFSHGLRDNCKQCPGWNGIKAAALKAELPAWSPFRSYRFDFIDMNRLKRLDLEQFLSTRFCRSGGATWSQGFLGGTAMGEAADGRDFAAGVALDEIADGSVLLGEAQGEPLLLARQGAECFAVGAVCTHYSGPLAEGLIVGDTIRCPWHHACFSLRTGEALRAPAFLPIDCWRVEQAGGKVFVREKRPSRAAKPPRTEPGRVGIIGGGAAGFAAAEMLRRENYTGSIMMISGDGDPPCDRPNLSKDYLAGDAPEDWIPLQPPSFYQDADIELILGTPVAALDAAGRSVELADGRQFSFDALLLAPGAEPARLAIPGADLPHVHLLRSLADSRAIIAGAKASQSAVVIGASFIGLEVAASLRARDLAVHVVAPEARPMERVLGPEAGDFIRALHESHGVTFHLGQTATSIDPAGVILRDGSRIKADLVVVGIGVRPLTQLAEQAGLALDRGIKVNEYLETSAAGIFAAGDAARWPDPLSRDNIRVEHWVVAERMGQTAARNILGFAERFDAVPFFWSQHYDLVFAYVGHAEGFDAIDKDGDLDAHDCALRYKKNGKVLAVATLFRDRESLAAEAMMEQAIRRAAPA
jgi:NADPH-dependent 2,4-dienoyl-CoA reductase/sulfur reductase-like enzyme/nitrite reductase/ring-hydroxylating ferredoxin subunit